MSAFTRAAVGVGLLLGTTWACGPAATGPRAPAVGPTVQRLEPTEGVFVTTACTPTGPELCFNALDDNCNGIIDEGCGSGTGVLQFMIAWGDSPADVDLSVTDPLGARLTKASRSTPSGLQLERNCPDDGCYDQNIENVFYEGAEPPRGRYLVEVTLVDARSAELPVHVRLSARIGSRTLTTKFELSPGADQDKKGFSFDI